MSDEFALITHHSASITPETMLVLIQPHSTLSLPGPPTAHQVFGALAGAVRALCGEADLRQLLELCDAGDPPMLLSAGFPWSGRGKRQMEFLPRPRLAWAPAGVDLVSRRLFGELAGGPPAEGTFAPTVVIREGAALSAEDAPGEAPVRFPRAVETARRGCAGRFVRTETAFAHGAGWYFLCHVRKPEWNGRLRGAIRWVCDTGWGADRSVGRGVGRAILQNNPLPAAETAETGARFATLSAFHPTAAERDFFGARLGESEYRLTTYEGRANRGRPLLCVGEGSVLPRPPGAGVVGSCVPLPGGAEPGDADS
jgi:hypothetical protein